MFKLITCSFFICLLSLICNAQKKLYYGFHLGTSYASTERLYEDQQHPNFRYKTKFQPAIGFMMEYWFSDHVGVRYNLKRLQIYGDEHSISDLLAEHFRDSTTNIEISTTMGFSGSGLSLNKNYHDISLQFRMPINKSKFYVRQAIGIVLVPNIKKYWYEPYEARAYQYPLLSYKSYNTLNVSNRFNYGFSANLGLDYKFGKQHDRFFFLNLDYTKCFVENEHYYLDYTVNGQNYKAGSRSNGDYFSAQFGYKAPWSTLRSKKKREELKSQNR